MSFNPTTTSPLTPHRRSLRNQEDLLPFKPRFGRRHKSSQYYLLHAEFKASINSLSIEAEAQAAYQMIAELDSDGSGQIEFPEFLYMMMTRPADNETRDEVQSVHHLRLAQDR